jgi:hypothetical protein
MHRASLAAITVTAVIALCGACSDGGGTPRDASPDTPIDMPGKCGTATFFTGEIIDWDATTDNFCGVFNAKLTPRDPPAQPDLSNPNGRFELCVPHQAVSLVDVMHSAAASPCVGVTGSYPVRGVLVAEQAVIDGNGVFSARAMTQPRQDAMFTQIGQPYSATQAQLFVHVDGTPRAVSISAPHAATQRFNGTIWAAGDTGSDVLFPNVDPGSVQVSVAGGAVGTTTLMLEADAYTYLTVIAN